MKKNKWIALGLLFSLCGCQTSEQEAPAGVLPRAEEEENMSEIITRERPEKLEAIPAAWQRPCQQAGRLEKLSYETWESFSYEEHRQRLHKEAWVYLPYDYTEAKRYNIFYISHGGWSNETTVLGTADRPSAFKYAMDHAIAEGLIEPLILVCPTYNNTSKQDSGDYDLAIQLTSRFHNELLNDLLPAAESRYRTYAETTTPEGLEASRDHRGFGGFSMGSVNTWNTFRWCLDYFRYFAPASGNFGADGEYLAGLVEQQGRRPEDFSLFACTGTADFAYAGFRAQLLDMLQTAPDMFTNDNTIYLEKEGYSHDVRAADEYMYNALRFFWPGENAKTRQ